MAGVFVPAGGWMLRYGSCNEKGAWGCTQVPFSYLLEAPFQNFQNLIGSEFFITAFQND